MGKCCSGRFELDSVHFAKTPRMAREIIEITVQFEQITYRPVHWKSSVARRESFDERFAPCQRSEKESQTAKRELTPTIRSRCFMLHSRNICFLILLNWIGTRKDYVFEENGMAQQIQVFTARRSWCRGRVLGLSWIRKSGQSRYLRIFCSVHGDVAQFPAASIEYCELASWTNLDSKTA